MNQVENNYEMISVVPLFEEFWMFLDKMANLWVFAELRCVDNASHGAVDISFIQTDFALCRHADEVTCWAKSNWIAHSWSQNAIFVTPAIEFDILLLLL